MESVKNISKDDIETFSWLWIEVVILFSAIFTGVLSFIFNDIIGDTTGLFARSGSIIVLLGVVNEYRLRKLRDRQLSYVEHEFLRNAEKSTKDLFRPKEFLSQKILTISTHITVVVGTIIWGFGDLFF